MNVRSTTVYAVLICSAFCANAADSMTSPQRLRLATEKSIATCLRGVERQGTTGNQLLADGYASCFHQAKYQLTERIERIAADIDLVKADECRNLKSDSEAVWTKYSEELMKIPALGLMPTNTDDELEVLLLTHRYEIVYAIARNPACRR
jgi:hypothetical protein